ncbi:putative C-type lectin domain family 20 member A [Ictalurus punctatus]|uniref:C-type lectin domain family 20 member A n=1 Tax=Ictalurus punctatus TaxID=7998 RepID=A0A2D0RP43_ICTPU|nr:putative C-type lectin domain family 20 member A [Ictalurus punctatus]
MDRVAGSLETIPGDLGYKSLPTSMMKQHLFILLFFTGVVPLVQSVTRKYFLVQQGRKWTDAQTYCQATYTDLAIIKSNDDVIQLQNEVQSQKFSSSAWIGMYSNISSWHWSLGYEPVTNILGNWDVGEPNNNGGKQNCGAATPWGWWDLKCTELRPFLCFDETKTGNNRYIYISNTVQWSEAQAYCRQYHTDLASARDETENSFIQALVTGITWFGLIKDPWKWVDHTNFSTISWMSGQPDNGQWDENCGYIYMGEAADASCSDILPFFCYSGTTKQQIMKMKIQSSQDVNDPAVNVAILEKIKQKLKDNGIVEDIEVKWRAQPDGEVFHKEK